MSVSGAAQQKLESLRESVASAPIVLGTDGHEVQVTISAGLASFPQDREGAAELFALADERMFQAKREGRNRVVASQNPFSRRICSRTEWPSKIDAAQQRSETAAPRRGRNIAGGLSGIAALFLRFTTFPSSLPTSFLRRLFKTAQYWSFLVVVEGLRVLQFRNPPSKRDGCVEWRKTTNGSGGPCSYEHTQSTQLRTKPNRSRKAHSKRSADPEGASGEDRRASGNRRGHHQAGDGSERSRHTDRRIALGGSAQHREPRHRSTHGISPPADVTRYCPNIAIPSGLLPTPRCTLVTCL